jgi:tRNA A-37 threonylcarbamoyl transferase component Bud32
MSPVPGESDVGGLPTVPRSLEPGVAPVRLAPGARAGDYVIDRMLGSGGMGEVYAGHHPVIGKKVAVKVIREHLATSPEAIARFTREARAVNQVDHPNVVDVFAIGRLDDGRLYLVMDLVDGASLRARVATGRLAPAEVLAILEPIAAALDAAHARGVVHRDLKPDNVMVSGAGDRPTVHVLDFGIAKLVSSVAATEDGRAALPPGTLTGQGTWLGTPAYMAPEQWSADGALPASDRYAFAVMTYELLAGAPPFAASTAPGLMEKHFRAEIPSVTGAGASVPPAVDDVIRRGMAKDPEQRFPSAIAMVEALRAALGTGAGLAIPGRRAAAAATTASGTRRSPVPWIAGALGVGVTAAGVWIVMRDRASGEPDDAGGATGRTAEVVTTPAGATITVDGVDHGVTPRKIEVAPGGSRVVLARPGYHGKDRTVVPGETWPVTLQPVVGFEGTWAMPSGELRRFVRQGDAVVALRLAAASEPGEFYRRFHFVPSTGAITSFAAEEEHVHPGHGHEPSCHVPLEARYDYDVGGDELELRKERAQLDVTPSGACVVTATEWGPPVAMTRIDRTAGTWAESRAGGGVTAGVPGFEPQEPLVDDTAAPTTNADTKPDVPQGKKKAPPPSEKQRLIKGARNANKKLGDTLSARPPPDQLDAQTRAANVANPPPQQAANPPPIQPPPQAVNPSLGQGQVIQQTGAPAAQFQKP